MIGISLWRVCKTALQNFWRNIWLSIATTVIMSLTLLMMSFLYFANVLGVEVLKTIEQKVDLSAVMKSTASEEQIKVVAEEIKAREDVQSVRIVTSADALQLFRQKHADDTFIEDSLKELEKNPLPASIFVVAKDPRSYESIAKNLQADKFSSYVEKVNFENSRPVIDKLIKFMEGIKNAGAIGTGIFAILVVLIMFNTIRLAIYSFREEIDIMRLVGASNWFIQGPFLVEAILVAIFGVIVCNLVLFPTLSATSPQIQSFFFNGTVTQFNLSDFATTNSLRLIAMQIALAISLSLFSSMVAIRRYLRK